MKAQLLKSKMCGLLKKNYPAKTPNGYCPPLSFVLKKYYLLKNRIKRSEGYRNTAYFDKLGFPTIGYGHLIRPYEKIFFNKKYSNIFLNSIFDADFHKAVIQYNNNYNHCCFKNNIKEMLIEMIFQLGINKQKKFVKMIKHLKNQGNLLTLAPCSFNLLSNH